MSPFATNRRESVAALGEEALIGHIRKWLGRACPAAPQGIGDDCAVLPAAPRGGRRLVTVDPVIYGRHFDAAVAPQQAGAKLLKRNLSDIAAMGGTPEAAVVSLILAPTLAREWLRRFYRGIASAAEKYGVAVVGGDIAQADSGFSATLTLWGTARRPVLRTGARVGDVLYVTGQLGGSVASGHHWRFAPRLAEGAWLAGRKEVRAMMDLSDGLAKDLRSLTPPETEPAILARFLPMRPGADLRSAISEGEDYELLLAVSGSANLPAFTAAWRRRFPRLALTPIGRFVSQGQVPPEAIPLRRFRGYEHLR